LQNDDFKRDSLKPCKINIFVSILPRFEMSSYAKQALAYRINWEINTPQAGESGILLHRKGMLTNAKSKSLRLSCSVVVNLPLSKISRYEADFCGVLVSYSLLDCRFMASVTGQQGILTPPWHLILPLLLSGTPCCLAYICICFGDYAHL
jgi:hypothetical protein